MNPQLAAASIGNTTLAFVTFMPAPDELLTGSPTTSLRVNETAAVAVSLGIGLVLSFAAGEAAPFAFAAITAAALVIGVEYLARANSAALSAPINYSPDRMV